MEEEDALCPPHKMWEKSGEEERPTRRARYSPYVESLSYGKPSLDALHCVRNPEIYFLLCPVISMAAVNLQTKTQRFIKITALLQNI